MSNLGHIDASALTDIGRVHSHNEDYVKWREPGDASDEKAHGWLYIVADGVGGAEDGEVASEFAAERMQQYYIQQSGEEDLLERMRNAIHAANQDLRQLGAQMSAERRMATTMVAVVVQQNEAIFTNVGDSRGYHWRRGELVQITRDHSLVAKLLEEGVLTAEQALHYPRSNVILYSLGSEHDPQVDQFRVSLEAGDVLMLCSDGLTRHVEDDEIARMLDGQPAAQAAQRLINLANERGGKDNISVILIRYWPGELGQIVSERGSGAATALLWLVTLTLSILQSAGIFVIWLHLFS